MQKYLNRISGPLLDRIDLHVEVTPVPFEELASTREEERSADIRSRVVVARNIQTERFEKAANVYCNAQMQSRMLKQYCRIDEGGMQILKQAIERLNLSGRAYDRILKVSRTIADLDGSEAIEVSHVAEAIQYRSLDRKEWMG